MADELYVPIPGELLDEVAQRVADIVIERLSGELRGTAGGRWMRAAEAAEYLGWTRGALYARVRSKGMPHYKVDGLLLFKRDELDTWLEQFRQPADSDAHGDALAHTRHRQQTAQPKTIARKAQTKEKPDSQRARRQRPLPPPIGGDEATKDRWARELEISRAELDDMSPTDFDKAWEARNQRLEDAGVFDHIDELEATYGWDKISEMTPTELVAAVREIGTTPTTNETGSE